MRAASPETWTGFRGPKLEAPPPLVFFAMCTPNKEAGANYNCGRSHKNREFVDCPDLKQKNRLLISAYLRTQLSILFQQQQTNPCKGTQSILHAFFRFIQFKSGRSIIAHKIQIPFMKFRCFSTNRNIETIMLTRRCISEDFKRTSSEPAEGYRKCRKITLRRRSISLHPHMLYRQVCSGMLKSRVAAGLNESHPTGRIGSRNSAHSLWNLRSGSSIRP
jgi:hypothetical protein